MAKQGTIHFVLITNQILKFIEAKSFSEFVKIKHPIAGSRTEMFPDRKGRRIFTSSESIERRIRLVLRKLFSESSFP